jgi:hypothetical protein
VRHVLPVPCKKKGIWDLASITPSSISVSISVSIIVTCDNIFVMGVESIDMPHSTWRRLAVSRSQCARIIVWITLGKFVNLTPSPDAVEKV